MRLEDGDFVGVLLETELSVPVGASKEKTEEALAAWYKMIEAGVSVGVALAREEGA